MPLYLLQFVGRFWDDRAVVVRAGELVSQLKNFYGHKAIHGILIVRYDFAFRLLLELFLHTSEMRMGFGSFPAWCCVPRARLRML